MEVSIQELPSKDILPHLEDGGVDLALTNLVPDPERFSFFRFYDDPIMLVALYTEKMRCFFPDVHTSRKPPGDRLGTAAGRDADVLHQPKNMRLAADAICRLFSFYPRTVIEVPSLASARSLVGSDRGITFVCPSSVSCIRPQMPLIYFSLGEMRNYTAILAVYRKSETTPLLQKFCECTAQALNPSAVTSTRAALENS